MSTETLFRLQLIFGYVAWLLCFRKYLMPKLRAMEPIAAQMAIATLHSFRFFGLVFMLPGFIGPQLPAAFGAVAAYWDFATGLLAMGALATVRIRPVFWAFVVAYNVVGILDLVMDYYHAIRLGVPAMAGQMGAAYAIPVLYVPLLMITHVAAFYLIVRVLRTGEVGLGRVAA